MIRLLRWIIYGEAHIHIWETIKEVNTADVDDAITGTRYYCQCTVCGTHKTFG